MKSLEKTSSLLKCLFLALIFIGQNFAYSQCDLIITSPSPTQVCPGTVVNLNAVATVYGANQSFNFNAGSLPSGWSVSGGPTFGTPCGAGPGGDYYWASTAVGVPNITTAGFDVCSGGSIVFDMRYAVQGGAAPCEGPDEPDEGVSIEYSLDGGATWIEFVYYHPNGTVLGANPGGNAPTVAGATPFTDWSTISVAIPPGAISANTMFRWVQTNSSGTCCDNWGIDNVYINAGPCLSANVNWSNGQNGVNNISPTINGAECFTADVYDDFGNYLCSSPTTFCFSVFIPSIDAGSDVTLCNGGSTTLTASGGSGFTWDNGVTNGVPFVPPLGTTTYTVSGTDVNGCAATDQVVLTVTPVTPPTINPAGPACIINGLLALSGTPAGGTFSGIGVTGTNFNPATAGAGTHTVTYTYTSGGCTGSATTNIVVNPLPVVSINAQANLCANSAAAGLVGNPAGGTFSGPGMTGSSFNPVTAGVGTHTITYTYTDGSGCTNNATTNITVTSLNTITAGTNQTVCINSAIANITLATTAATGATFTGLPAGVLGAWAGNVATISGTPTVAGTFNYTVTTTGGCPPATSTGTITVTPLNTIAAGTNQTVCMNSAIANITLATTGATGATFAGLPAGVTGAWVGSVATISGTPTVSGTFNYTVTTTGGCPPATTTGVITVTPLNTIAAGTNQTVCMNSAIANITLATTGATGATFAGLPAGVTGAWAGNVAAISGTPTASGTFNYTVTTTGGCPPATATGTITVTPFNTIAIGVDRTTCINSAIANITLATTGATGVTFAGLPAGVAGSWVGNVVTISGTPTVGGIFNYTVTTTGGCPPATATGTITVILINTIAAGTNQIVCVNSAITNITLATTGATGATFAGLPAGVNGSWAGNIVTISGTPTLVGTFNYTVATTGGCPPATTTGTITVNPLPTAVIIGEVALCHNDANPNITFMGATGTAPYTFTYAINGGASQTVTTVGASSTVTVSVPTATPGTFVYNLTSVQDGSSTTCSNSQVGSVTVIVYAYPPIDAGVDQLICQNGYTNVVAINPTGVPIYWDNGVNDGVTFSPSGPTTYTVTADNNGCISTDDVFVDIELLPTIDFSGDVLQGCEPLLVNFTSTSFSLFGLTNCVWNFGDGNTATGCGTVANTFENAGYYDVTLTATSNNGCVNTDTYVNYIYVEAYPNASFTPTNIVINSMLPVVNYENTTTGASTYIWNFGDQSATSSQMNPSYTFPAESAGQYTVTFIASSQIGCTDTAYGYVRVEEVLIYYVPNTFTPDGDSYNETFKPVFTDGFDPYSFSMFIYNRWGEVIWESHDSSVGWNGMYGGNKVSDGIYTWKIEFKTSMNDERVMDIGHVNIIK
jgi:gliding motility-associated-like protein